MCFEALVAVVSVYTCGLILPVASCCKAPCVPEISVIMQSNLCKLAYSSVCIDHVYLSESLKCDLGDFFYF